eukprot:m.354384 g.354384  ORF g.354384 m.354384 type:complete len:215 (+) comp16997_c0_seq1:240-884(+)
MSFDPYSQNGGTVLGIAGEDYAIIASDTRLSEGYSIHSRDVSKLYPLNGVTVLGCTGFHGDVITLVKRVEMRQKSYAFTHRKDMSTTATAQMLATMLYGKRFFPYYTYNILGGIDSEGKGCVYSYDPVGSYEREVFRAAGTASSLLQPLLDNQVGFKNQEGKERVPIPMDRAVAMVKDVFSSAAERDIYTGDAVAIAIITKDGVKYEQFPLRRD